MKKIVWLSILVGFVALLRATPTLAISLDLVPNSPTVMAGDLLDVDVVISGLVAGGSPSVGAFDLDVSFDPAILSPTDVTFGPFLGDPNLFEALTDFTFLPGIVDLAEVSLLSSAELDALQPDPFTLATLSFSAFASGTTTLTFSQIIIDDAFGNKIPIPEPSTLPLLGAGLAGLLAYGWRRHKQT